MLRILIIDDDDGGRACMVSLLRSAGHRVEHHRVTPAVLDAVAGLEPDVAVLGLSASDGYESPLEPHAAILRCLLTTPTILVTPMAPPRGTKLARTLGAVAYLGKPVDATLLLDHVKQAARDPGVLRRTLEDSDRPCRRMRRATVPTQQPWWELE